MPLVVVNSRVENKTERPPKRLRSSAPPGTQKHLRFSRHQRTKKTFVTRSKHHSPRTLEPVTAVPISRTQQARLEPSRVSKMHTYAHVRSIAAGEVFMPEMLHTTLRGYYLYTRKHVCYFPFQAAYTSPKHERTWVGKGLTD